MAGQSPFGGEEAEDSLMDISKVTLIKEGKTEEECFGPAFNELAEDVQVAFKKYLAVSVSFCRQRTLLFCSRLTFLLSSRHP